jgi:hypothetical protein
VSGSKGKREFRKSTLLLIQQICKFMPEKFAGCSDCRLPTLEETMSLMEPTMNEERLYINSVFNKAQTEIWTADKNPFEGAWFVDFVDGGCNTYNVLLDIRVHAVRCGQ